MTEPQHAAEIRWQRDRPERNLYLETRNLSHTLLQWLHAYELVPADQRAMTDNLTRSAVIQTLGVIDRGQKRFTFAPETAEQSKEGGRSKCADS